MSDDENPAASLAELRTSLTSVEETLGPLLEQKWSETTAALGIMDRAKMDVLVSYAINDLIWVYLKMKGVDPATHDVSAELERIRTYYGKVKAVEEPESRRTTRIDQGAAGRIIKHAIPASQRTGAQPAATSAAASARAQAEAAHNEQLGRSHRFRFVAKNAERVDVDMSDDQDDSDEEAQSGEEADGLYNELETEFGAAKARGKGANELDEDRKKRKRAEDFTL